MSTYTRVLRTIAGSETLLSVLFTVQTTFTLSATNYWTVTVRRRRVGQTIGETVGSAYSLATRTLTAGTPVTIYESAQGLAMTDGELLVATLETTGSPAALDEPTLTLEIQRNTR